MTIKQLIRKLDSLFHQHVVLHWKPSAIRALTPLQEQAEASAPALHLHPCRCFCLLQLTPLQEQAEANAPVAAPLIRRSPRLAHPSAKAG